MLMELNYKVCSCLHADMGSRDWGIEINSKIKKIYIFTVLCRIGICYKNITDFFNKIIQFLKCSKKEILARTGEMRINKKETPLKKKVAISVIRT